jgi:hypothetical protein
MSTKTFEYSPPGLGSREGAKGYGNLGGVLSIHSNGGGTLVTADLPVG